jgi:hypothetical protein
VCGSEVVVVKSHGRQWAEMQTREAVPVSAMIRKTEQAAAERAQNIAPVRLDHQLARLAEKWGAWMVQP